MPLVQTRPSVVGSSSDVAQQENRAGRAGVAAFHFEPNLAGKGPSVVVLVGASWTWFLRERVGVTSPAFFERPALSHEPDKRKDGQPFAWVYRKPGQMLLDEARWLAADQQAKLAAAFETARGALAEPQAEVQSGPQT